MLPSAAALRAGPGQAAEEGNEPGRAGSGELDEQCIVRAAHSVFAAVERRVGSNEASKPRARAPGISRSLTRVLSTEGRGEAWGRRRTVVTPHLAARYLGGNGSLV